MRVLLPGEPGIAPGRAGHAAASSRCRPPRGASNDLAGPAHERDSARKPKEAQGSPRKPKEAQGSPRKRKEAHGSASGQQEDREEREIDDPW